MEPTYKFTLRTSMKRYSKMEGYSAHAHSPISFLRHCSFYFRTKKGKPLFSHEELIRAMYANKILVFGVLVK